MTNGDEVRTVRDVTGGGPVRRAAPGTGGLIPSPRGRQRADAVRNRAQILGAAEQLFTERDPGTVTMDQIAKAAGVGRATLYRRFPDPPSVAAALLDEHERILQGRLAFGPPPLGPGAPPAERLAAFYAAALEHLERHLPLALGIRPGPDRFGRATYRHWRAHVRSLLADAGAADPDAAVDVLLSPLAPEVYQFQRHTLGLPPERIAETLGRLARGVLPDRRIG
ncbi:TetR/AcrR family transcriptional regulator [Streptomyces lavendulae]|uniref:TetR/AcrR family transcriptional regulator n=1 Tax=Streptomyces lavendulae TaxID=1914 RepID=UPI0024A27E38|nr:TetR/AcrR family transcriptional regulator [Streptomyces lavendulae]GLV98087.1 TetR family transcriptional regulator [Streptomyces lavendulae subsp. lavendulae]